MRSLVVRRHSLRSQGDEHLSAAGVALARQVGGRSGTFHRVVTSPKARALETAVAMGFTVDATRDELGSLPESVGRFLDREAPVTFEEYVRWVGQASELRQAAEVLASCWSEELARVPDGGRLLMISHAGLIELGTVGAAPGPVSAWGRALAPLDGVRLDAEGSRWIGATLLRAEGGTGSADGGSDPGPDGGGSAGRIDRAEDPLGPIVL
jgi:broad specificity phosphatase PhoE